MSFGVGEAVGVISLSLTCLHSCIKTLTLLSKARHYDQDVSNIRLQIELEQHFLFTWAEAAGLTQDPPTLNVTARDAVFVLQILQQLDDLLSDLQKLKNRYGLDLKSISEDVEALDDDNSTLSKLGPKARDSVSRANTSIFSRRKSPWKKLRWVSLDDKKVGKLLEVVKGYTSQLERFLEPLNLAKRGADLDGVLRDAILNVNDYHKLDIIGRGCHQASSQAAIAAAARLKQTRLMLGFSDSSFVTASASVHEKIIEKTTIEKPSSFQPSHFQSSTHMKLSMRSLTLSRFARAQVHRALAHYENRAVLLEWKRQGELEAEYLKKRVNQVAAFLQHIEPSFHSLPCLGYVKDYELCRFGYIFELPEAFQTSQILKQPIKDQPSLPSLPPLPSLRSLRELFDRSVIPPSLNDRLSISVILLETLLNLHTSGWLHKEFRSDNIILIRNDSDVEDCVERITTYSIHIAGYVYARTDRPGEATELPISEMDADLYRHPQSLGGSRKSFRKSFDIFSVGCTLLEIGLWSSLRQILEQHAARQLPSRLPILQHIGPPWDSSNSNNSASTEIAAAHQIQHSAKGYEDAIGLSPDVFMKLRHELVLAQLPNPEAYDFKAGTDTNASIGGKSRCRILQSLEAATGSVYTSIVEELLATGSSGHYMSKSEDGKDHEDALDLEIKARDTIRGIMRAI